MAQALRESRQIAPREPLGGPHLGFPKSPEDLLIDDDHTPVRIDKAFSWDAPLAAHGLMHMVINNAALGDPYPIDVLFMYMANMGWNSSMNVPDTLKHLTEKDPETGEYKIPKFIYADSYFSETVPYADLVLPDTTYLERWDCISSVGPADFGSRWTCRLHSPAGGGAGSRRAAVPGGSHRARRASQTAGIFQQGRQSQISRRLPGLYRQSRAQGPAWGRSRAGAEARAKLLARERANPKQLEKYIENGCFWFHELEPDQRYFKHANATIWNLPSKWVSASSRARPSSSFIWKRCRSSVWPRWGTDQIVPPAEHRQRIKAFFDPLPFWYAPFEGAAVDEAEFPLHAVTQRPMHMYHSWGSQNAWLRQITAANRLYIHRKLGRELDVADDDWVWISSHIGRVRCQVKLMDGVNPRHGLDLECHRQAPARLDAGRGCTGVQSGILAESSDRRALA